MAETLVRMRRGLRVVGSGELPEFDNGRERVAALEDRLETLVAPALAEALAAHQAARAQELCSILTAIGRYSALERQYTASRLPPLLAAWEAYDTKEGEAASSSFAEWLPSFYDATLSLLQAEARWCVTVFPQHHALLVGQLLQALLERTLDAFQARLQDTLMEAQASAAQLPADVDGTVAAALASGGSLGALLAAHQATVPFARGLRALLAGLGAGAEAYVLRRRSEDI